MTSAETSSQQPGPEVTMQEIKTEVQTDDAEPDPGESKGEPRSEVHVVPQVAIHGLCVVYTYIYLYILRTYHDVWIFILNVGVF